MNGSPIADIDQHNKEIQENRQYWEQKPQLREEYKRFYRHISDSLIGVPDGPVLECGSGIGNIKSVLPHAITSDLFPNPWLDRTENVYALSFASNTLAAVVLFDVFHHLEYPGTALAEIHRALMPGGRLILFEPAMGLLGRLTLGLFHHEPLGLDREITWHAPSTFDPQNQRYYAAQGNAWRIFQRRETIDHPSSLELIRLETFPALSWIMTGGFRGRAFCPHPLRFAPKAIDAVLGLAPTFFASRMLVLLQKKTL